METSWERRKLSRTLSSQSAKSRASDGHGDNAPESPSRAAALSAALRPDAPPSAGSPTPSGGARTPFESVQAQVGVVGPYQLLVFFLTQVGYLAATGSLLCGSYDSWLPDWVNCSDANYTGATNLSVFDGLADSEPNYFESIVYAFGPAVHCHNRYVVTFFNTAVMVGGFAGAVACGYAADAAGRKPTLVLTELGLTVLNAGLATVGAYNWALTAAMMLALGACAGGFMVVNMVLLLETVGNDYWRFATVAFNGWPMGLVVQALLGYLTRGYWGYHLCLSGVAGAVALCTVMWCDESARWLVQTRRVAPAIAILHRTASMNGRSGGVDFNALKVDEAAHAAPSAKGYTYVDLWRAKRIRLHLSALFYSWLASAIISFAIYQLVADFAGNRYLNTALLGLFKQATGLIPFFVANCVGRKVSLMIGVSLTCAACWLALGAYALSSDPSGGVFISVMGIAAAAAIDPIWKVNHLYSMELFPTVVRNMARAVCNTGSRTGSVLAQLVVLLATVIHTSAPWVIFSLLATGQLAICYLCLPETKGKRLPDQLDDNVFAPPEKAAGKPQSKLATVAEIEQNGDGVATSAV